MFFLCWAGPTTCSYIIQEPPLFSQFPYLSLMDSAFSSCFYGSQTIVLWNATFVGVKNLIIKFMPMDYNRNTKKVKIIFWCLKSMLSAMSYAGFFFVNI